ncbi:MAG: LLM class flavin-dependent oxidoreductase [Chloroflexota bacterium]|nr:LLM class flavin-dependent oxidoreductase [Chloroflexota bacterium]
MLGIGLTENMTLAAQADIMRVAYENGYESAWCNESRGRDGFMTCQARAAAVPSMVTGIGVVPVLHRLPLALAMQTATLSELTGGKFILGVGSASVAGSRHTFGIDVKSPLRLMRDYLTAIRSYLAGARVEMDSEVFQIHGDRIDLQPFPLPAPLYLAALGPKMQELAGEVADGVLLNWHNPGSLGEVRQRLAAGAARAGRRPDLVKLSGYVRVSVDDDREAARAAMAEQAFRYAMIPPYRRHFERMGFKAITDRLASQPAEERFTGADEEMLRSTSVYGTPAEVRAALPGILALYDDPIVRIVPARPGVESIQAVIEAGAPAA